MAGMVEKNRTKIDELRIALSERLKKNASHATDFSLLRWLDSYDFDIDCTVKNFAVALNRLENLNAINLNFNNGHEINDFLKTRVPATQYFPGGLMGSDRSGNIVCMQPMGLAKPKTLIKLGRVSDFYRALIFEIEATMHILRLEEIKLQKRLFIILVMDLTSFSMETLFMSAIKIYLNSLTLFKSYFPGALKKVYVINTPSIINIVLQVAKAVLTAEALNSIDFLGDNWQDTLFNEIGRQNVLEYWNGSKKCVPVTGAIRMGGDVPESFVEEIEKTFQMIPEDELTSVSISAKEEISLKFEVTKSGTRLSWYFVVLNGGIDFWISLQEDEVWPPFQISTEFVPEFGEITCNELGIYALHFSNKGAKFWKKTIKYMIKCSCDE